jgi:hypothetical protein
MSHNEEIIHYFGYVDDGRPDNNTPYFNYKGKAQPENVAKSNKFRELNEKAVQLRKDQIKNHGKTPPREL